MPIIHYDTIWPFSTGTQFLYHHVHSNEIGCGIPHVSCCFAFLGNHEQCGSMYPFFRRSIPSELHAVEIHLDICTLLYSGRLLHASKHRFHLEEPQVRPLCSETDVMIRFGATFAGGFTDMLFCIFCMMSVKGSGLSNSCPLQIGLATVFGSILTSMQRVCITIRYCIEKKGNLYYLIPGLLMNITGIALNSITYSYEKPFAFIVVASRKIRRVL